MVSSLETKAYEEQLRASLEKNIVHVSVTKGAEKYRQSWHYYHCSWVNASPTLPYTAQRRQHKPARNESSGCLHCGPFRQGRGAFLGRGGAEQGWDWWQSMSGHMGF